MQRNGFTLIELLVVISIVSVLSSIAVTSLGSAREKARIAAGASFEQSILTSRGDFLQLDLSFDASSITSLAQNIPLQLIGSATYSDDTPSGKGKSLQLNNAYINATLDVSESKYLVSFWFKTTSQYGLFYQVNSAGNDREIGLNAGSAYSRVWSEETIISPSANYADGKWHHLVHTYGGKTGGQELYVDGVRVAKGTKSDSDFNWQTNVFIGPGNYNGLLDNMRVYETSLGGE